MLVRKDRGYLGDCPLSQTKIQEESCHSSFSEIDRGRRKSARTRSHWVGDLPPPPPIVFLLGFCRLNLFPFTPAPVFVSSFHRNLNVRQARPPAGMRLFPTTELVCSALRLPPKSPSFGLRTDIRRRDRIDVRTSDQSRNHGTKTRTQKARLGDPKTGPEAGLGC